MQNFPQLQKLPSLATLTYVHMTLNPITKITFFRITRRAPSLIFFTTTPPTSMLYIIILLSSSNYKPWALQNVNT